MNEIEKAERIQAWKAFLIPSTLFVACLLNAAGIYIIYTGSSLGIAFLGTGFFIIMGAMFAAITLQNKHRAEGNWKQVTGDLPDFQDADSDEEAEAEEAEEREPASVR